MKIMTHSDASDRVRGKKVRVGKSLILGENASIKADIITIEDNVKIGNNTRISAQHIHLGFGSEIEENCKIILSGSDSELSLGDNCLLGHDSKILVPTFRAGDYVTLHNHLFVNGTEPCLIGSNVWVGQNCILNAADKLTIGNGVGIGTYSCIWTHGGHGEVLEGCTLLKFAPVVIEDDVWIVGSYNVISPGVRLGKRAVILTGSVVTKDVAPGTCVAGNPARDISDKITPYKDISLDQKYELMKDFVEQFVGKFYAHNAAKIENGWTVSEEGTQYQILFFEDLSDELVRRASARGVVFAKRVKVSKIPGNLTIFDLNTKTYTKKRTKMEVKIIKFLLYSKARFLPSRGHLKNL